MGSQQEDSYWGAGTLIDRADEIVFWLCLFWLVVLIIRSFFTLSRGLKVEGSTMHIFLLGLRQG